MSKLLSTMFRLSPATIALGILTAISHSVSAAPDDITNLQVKTNHSLAQTSFDTATTNKLESDPATAERVKQAAEALEIRPTDWAYQTLLALTNKYECGALPASDRALSREEFATNLHSCLRSMEDLVALDGRRKRRPVIRKRRPVMSKPSVVPPVPAEPEPVAPNVPEPLPSTEPAAAPPPPENTVTKEDLDAIKELTESFRPELESLDGRLKVVEQKTDELKDKSFSTTTKLAGEVIFALTSYGGVTATATRPSGNTIFSDRVRLNFDTSFAGKDRLRTRLQSRNIAPLSGNTVTGTNMTRLGVDGNENNATSLSLLQYTFPLSKETKVIVETVGSEFNEDMNTFNPLLASSGSGSISRFGRFNPVYRLSGDGTAVVVNHKFSKELGLALGYAVPGSTASSPALGSGLFSGSNAFIGQLGYSPSSDLDLGLVYARSYHSGGSGVTGSTGSGGANNPFGGAPTTANHYSFLASYKIGSGAVLSGWAGFIDANRETVAGGSANISNYALSLALPNLVQEGDTLAFIVGVPPKLNSRSGTGLAAADPDTSLHLEALYKMKLSKNLEITPGLLVITNPEHRSANSTEYVGTLRTTFKF